MIRIIATVTPITRVGVRATCEYLVEFRCDVCGARLTGLWSQILAEHDRSHIERDSSYINLCDWFEPVTDRVM